MQLFREKPCVSSQRRRCVCAYACARLTDASKRVEAPPTDAARVDVCRHVDLSTTYDDSRRCVTAPISLLARDGLHEVYGQRPLCSSPRKPRAPLRSGASTGIVRVPRVTWGVGERVHEWCTEPARDAGGGPSRRLFHEPRHLRDASRGRAGCRAAHAPRADLVRRRRERCSRRLCTHDRPTRRDPAASRPRSEQRARQHP